MGIIFGADEITVIDNCTKRDDKISKYTRSLAKNNNNGMAKPVSDFEEQEMY